MKFDEAIKLLKQGITVKRESKPTTLVCNIKGEPELDSSESIKKYEKGNLDELLFPCLLKASEKLSVPATVFLIDEDLEADDWIKA